MNGVRAADILELHGEKLTSSKSSEHGQLNKNPFAIFKVNYNHNHKAVGTK